MTSRMIEQSNVVRLREIASCPTCGEAKRHIVYASTFRAIPARGPIDPYAAHYQINRCANCGLLFSSPILDEQGVRQLYSHGSETNVSMGEQANVAKTMRGYYALARPYLMGRERILDIGCDIGLLLRAARDDGFQELHGVEPVPLAREQAKKLVQASISSNFYEETEFPPDFFDLITLIHVVDHLVEPTAVLRRMLKNLKPGGVALAVVHNVASLLGRLLKERFPIFNLYHHYFFSKETLARLFAAHGFEVIKVVSTSNCYSLGFFASRVPGLSPALRSFAVRKLEQVKLASVPVSIPVGNIGIVARRPSAPRSNIDNDAL